MQRATLVFVFHEQSVLLAMKKRGLGMGKFNAPGGKQNGDEETIQQCAVREVHEEVGLEIPLMRLKPMGIIEFNFPDKLSWSNECHLFVCHQEREDEFGTPVESEEMKPQWFNVAELPYDHMWNDDRIWLPRLLRGETVRYRFWHDAVTSEILRYECLQ